MYELKKMVNNATIGMSIKEQKEMQVYIGDDEELNGVHQAYCAGYCNRDNEYDKYIFQNIDDCSLKGEKKVNKIYLIS